MIRHELNVIVTDTAKFNLLNKFKWTYIDDRGKRHLVGLMHGVESGNLLIICNNDILLIDFQVWESKSYSFIIEEELCEIEIEKRGSNFLYGFHTDNKVDTPLNRRRKKLEKKHLFQSLAFLGGMIAIIFFSAYFLTNSQKNSRKLNYKAILTNYHQFTKARITSQNDKKDSYSFIVNGKTYTANTTYRNISPGQLEHGMPVEPGDEFIVKYFPDNPSISEIDLNQPSEKQTRTYSKRTLEKHKKLHPRKSIDYCKCLVDVALETSGLKGLADLYHQDVSVRQNKQHNSGSYQQLIKKPSFRAQVKERCSGH